jgi:hypothetical protein
MMFRGGHHLAIILEKLEVEPEGADSKTEKEGLSACFRNFATTAGRSHQQSQAPFLRGIEFRADAVHSRRASAITDILEAVVAGKVRGIAIAREVGDSVPLSFTIWVGKRTCGSFVLGSDYPLKWIGPTKCANWQPTFLDPSAFGQPGGRSYLQRTKCRK